MYRPHASKLRPGVRLLMFVCLFLGSQLGHTSLLAQPVKAVVFKNPVVDVISSDVALHIDAVILTGSVTSLKITAKYIPGHRLNIPKESYVSFEDAGSIKGADTGKYFVSSTAGVEIGNKNHMPASGVLQYTLNFPLKLPNKTINNNGLKLHFGEDLPDGKQVYGIDYLWQGRPMAKELIGRWYNKATGDLAYIIRPDVVISADGQIDSITGGNAKEGVLSVVNNGQVQVLYYRLKEGTLRIGASKPGLEKRVVYVQDLSLCHRVVATAGYQGQQFKTDTSAIKGYIIGYKRTGQGKKTLHFTVSDPILGMQVNYLAEVQPDGIFEVKFPVYGPIQPMVSSMYCNGYLYLEPGKTLVMVLGLGEPAYLGPLAELNNDMKLLDKNNKVDWGLVSKQVGIKDALEIKCDVLSQKGLLNARLDSVYRTGGISAKAYEQKKLMIKYDIATILLFYEMQYEQNYRANKHLPDTAKVPPANIPVEYYDFLTADLMDNPDILQYSFGFIFINYLKFRSPWFAKTSVLTIDKMYQALAAKGVQFSRDEMSVINYRQKDGQVVDSAQRLVNGKKAKEFLSRYAWECNMGWDAHSRDSIMQTYGIAHGVANEIMYVEDYASRVWSQLTPVDSGKLRRMQMEIKSPILKSQMAVINNQVLDKIARSKNNTGFYVRNSEDIKADQIFDSIVSAYKGNLLYIDFWATWCSPCRQAIEEIKPVKEKFSGKPVKFIYLTNESSPLGTWKNFIRDIKGEHYRLNEDQWNYLCTKFNVTGIPHVVLVDKDSKVIDPHYAFFGQDIKAKIEGLL